MRWRLAQNDLRQNGTQRALEDMVVLLRTKERVTRDEEDITIIVDTSGNSFRALKVSIYSPESLGGGRVKIQTDMKLLAHICKCKSSGADGKEETDPWQYGQGTWLVSNLSSPQRHTLDNQFLE